MIHTLQESGIASELEAGGVSVILGTLIESSLTM